MLDLLDNIIPATLDVYISLFRNNRFDKYYETIIRLWMFMAKLQCKNYDKAVPCGKFPQGRGKGVSHKEKSTTEPLANG